MWTDERKAAAQEELLRRIGDGETIVAIARDAHMPSRTTVFCWERDDAGFANALARAREQSAVSHIEDALETARSATPENAAAARLVIQHQQWMASRFNRALFGDRQQVEHSGGVTLTHESALAALEGDNQE